MNQLIIWGNDIGRCLDKNAKVLALSTFSVDQGQKALTAARQMYGHLAHFIFITRTEIGPDGTRVVIVATS